jgi:hypothetical protein
MKTFILALISFSAFSALAQDTIFTRNGEVIPAKVYEITATEVKYKKPSNPDGPLYTTAKDNVTLIEYKNGSKDVFQQTSDNTNNNSTQTQAQSGNVTNNTYYPSPRPRVNVVIAPPPVVIGPAWGWGYGYYRPYRYHRYWRHGWCW